MHSEMNKEICRFMDAILHKVEPVIYIIFEPQFFFSSSYSKSTVWVKLGTQTWISFPVSDQHSNLSEEPVEVCDGSVHSFSAGKNNIQ